MAKYERLILKVTGESLGTRKESFDSKKINELSLTIKKLREEDVKIAIVLGAGNFFRGRDGESGSDPKLNDFLGMVFTVSNAIKLKENLQRIDVPTIIMSALGGFGEGVVENYDKEKALNYFNDKHLLILAGGIGESGYTTDTTASQRAEDLQCEVILKGSTVNGVYEKDPRKYPLAKRYDLLTFDEAIEKELGVMDETAFKQCKTNNIPIIVFSMEDLSNIEKIIRGEENVGTIVKNNI
jgi:uridylate kinase